MAEAQSPPAALLLSLKKEIDDQLTCGVCLDRYNNPKELPCHHSFCLACIQRIPVKRVEVNQYNYMIVYVLT